MTAAAAPLVWTTDIKLFSPAMLRQWTVAMLVTALVMTLLLGTIAAAQDDWDALPSFAIIAAGAAGGAGRGHLADPTGHEGPYRSQGVVGDPATPGQVP